MNASASIFIRVILAGVGKITAGDSSDRVMVEYGVTPRMRQLAVMRSTSILRREFRRAASRQIRAISSLEQRCCSAARHYWRTRPFGCVREYSAVLAAQSGDCSHQSCHGTNTGGAMTFI